MGSPEEFLAKAEAKSSGLRELTGRSPRVGREGGPRKKKMRKFMEEWL